MMCARFGARSLSSPWACSSSTRAAIFASTRCRTAESKTRGSAAKECASPSTSSRTKSSWCCADALHGRRQRHARYLPLRGLALMPRSERLVHRDERDGGRARSPRRLVELAAFARASIGLVAVDRASARDFRCRFRIVASCGRARSPAARRCCSRSSRSRTCPWPTRQPCSTPRRCGSRCSRGFSSANGRTGAVVAALFVAIAAVWFIQRPAFATGQWVGFVALWRGRDQRSLDGLSSQARVRVARGHRGSLLVRRVGLHVAGPGRASAARTHARAPSRTDRVDDGRRRRRHSDARSAP